MHHQRLAALIYEEADNIVCSVKTIWAVIVFFCFLLIYYLWQVFTVFFPASTVLHQQKMSIMASKVEPIPDIAAWHLFGVYQDAASLLPTSQLQLTIVGVFAAEPMEYSQAIIASGDGIQKNYFIGDVLPGNAILTEVLADGVVVRHKGRLEKIVLPKPELEFKSPPAP